MEKCFRAKRPLVLLPFERQPRPSRDAGVGQVQAPEHARPLLAEFRILAFEATFFLVFTLLRGPMPQHACASSLWLDVTHIFSSATWATFSARRTTSRPHFVGLSTSNGSAFCLSAMELSAEEWKMRSAQTKAKVEERGLRGCRTNGRVVEGIDFPP